MSRQVSRGSAGEDKELEDEFDITIPAVEIVPENFNSAEAMWTLITRLMEE